MGFRIVLLPLLCVVSATVLSPRIDNGTPPYKDASLSPVERADDLLGRMTWEEKVGQMGGVRRLAGPHLAFNKSSYEEYTKTQNGILGESGYIPSSAVVDPAQVLATCIMTHLIYSQSPTRFGLNK